MGIACLEISAATFVLLALASIRSRTIGYMRIPEQSGLMPLARPGRLFVAAPVLDAVVLRSPFQCATYASR